MNHSKVPMRFEADVPDNWREMHKCSGERDKQGRCLFCQWNAPDGVCGSRGLEVIPFDVPGVYDPDGEPNILIREKPCSS